MKTFKTAHIFWPIHPTVSNVDLFPSSALEEFKKELPDLYLSATEDISSEIDVIA